MNRMITNVASTARHVLSDHSVTTLSSRGLITDVINGARKISKLSYMSRDSVDGEVWLEIPDELNSVKALEFLELNEDTAAMIFNDYLIQKALYPDKAEILTCAKRHVRHVLGDARLKTEDWRGVMNRIGLKGSYQNTVLDKVHNLFCADNIRANPSCKDTTIWMMESRFEFLRAVDGLVLASKNPDLEGKSTSNGRLQIGSPAILERSGARQPPIGTGRPQTRSSSPAEDTETTRIVSALQAILMANNPTVWSRHADYGAGETPYSLAQLIMDLILRISPM